MDSNKYLIDKALAICEEIERRQAELRAVLSSLTAEDDTPHSPVAEIEELQSAATPEPEEPAETIAGNESPATAEPNEDNEPQPVENQAPSPSADLRRAFTINDRFRFRRELFAGDDNAFAEAVSRLGRCADFAEAQALISSFGWDADNEAAAEFKEIVSNFFNGFHL